MAQTSKTYTGTSVRGNATIENALTNALEAAARGENTTHFYWTLMKTHGDYGGIAEKTITVEIAIQHKGSR